MFGPWTLGVPSPIPGIIRIFLETSANPGRGWRCFTQGSLEGRGNQLLGKSVVKRFCLANPLDRKGVPQLHLATAWSLKFPKVRGFRGRSLFFRDPQKWVSFLLGSLYNHPSPPKNIQQQHKTKKRTDPAAAEEKNVQGTHHRSGERFFFPVEGVDVMPRAK